MNSRARSPRGHPKAPPRCWASNLLCSCVVRPGRTVIYAHSDRCSSLLAREIRSSGSLVKARAGSWSGRDPALSDDLRSVLLVAKSERKTGVLRMHASD